MIRDGIEEVRSRVAAMRSATPDERLAWMLIPVAVVLAAGAGWLAVYLAMRHSPKTGLVVPLVALPVVVWKRPQVGLYIMMGATVCIEQYTYTVGYRPGAATDKIPFFRSIKPGEGVTPAEGLLFLLVLIWFLDSVRARRRLLPRTGLSYSVMTVLLMTALYAVIGLSRHGVFKIVMWEIRPFFYLGLTYLIASTLLARGNSLRILMWIMVLGSGFKALYGLWLWHYARHMVPRPDAILAHEESFFFALVIFLTLGMWLWGLRGPLRTVATVLLPFVTLADVANTRRTAFGILGAGVIVFYAVGYASLPNRRRLLRRLVPLVIAVAALYFPAFWNKSGTVASAAEAIHSIVKPNARDLSSDTYRIQENKNLALNIKRSDNLGMGFGIPIDYAIPIVNISSIDSMIKYVPHDNVLWVWMREGFAGEVAYWMMLAAAVFKAGQLTRRSDLDREGAAFAAMVIGGIVGYIVMGYEDMGFDWFRIAFAMGILLGAIEARAAVQETYLATLIPRRERIGELV